MKKVGILILAHRGVQNADLWATWASSDVEHPIELFALCESGEDRICVSCGLKDIHGIRQSKWCGKKIALNTLRAFRHICNTRDDLIIIYLVSGFCLPLQSPAFFYQSVISLPKSHVDGGKQWNPRDTSMCVIKHHPRRIIECTQWIALTPACVRQIKDDSSLEKLLDNRKIVSQKCPDEWYIQSLIWRQNIPFQDVAFVDICHSNHLSKHALTWDLSPSQASKKRRIEWDDDSYTKMNANQFLLFAQKAKYAFARKFSQF